MRILNWTIGLLLISNLALLMFPDQQRPAAHIYATQRDVKPNLLRLNKEVEARFLSDSSKAPEISSDYTQLGSLDANPVSPGGCYRLGPFMHQSNYDLAQAVLFNASVEYTKKRRKSTESSVTRLFIGPFDRQAQVSDERVTLKRKKVLDHFVRKDDDGRYLISLGIYSSKPSAQRAVKLFSDKGIKVEQREETIMLPESYWLHFDLSGKEGTRSELSSMDWGEQSTKIGVFECQ